MATLSVDTSTKNFCHSFLYRHAIQVKLNLSLFYNSICYFIFAHPPLFRSLCWIPYYILSLLLSVFGFYLVDFQSLMCSDSRKMNFLSKVRWKMIYLRRRMPRRLAVWLRPPFAVWLSYCEVPNFTSNLFQFLFFFVLNDYCLWKTSFASF